MSAPKEWQEDLTQRVLTNYRYNEELGIVEIAYVPKHTRHHIGDKIGAFVKNQWVTSIKYQGKTKVLSLARIIWLLKNGTLPKGFICFKDGNPFNIRYENLYEKVANPKPKTEPRPKRVKKPKPEPNTEDMRKYSGVRKVKEKRETTKPSPYEYNSAALKALIDAPIPKLEDLKKGCCKYPTVEGFWCNAETVDKASYCDIHINVCNDVERTEFYRKRRIL